MIFVSSNRPGGGLIGNLGCLIFAGLFLVGLFYVLQGLYKLLMYLAPGLFILTLIINWRVIAQAGQQFIQLFTRRPLLGLLVAALSVVLFPVLTLYWLLAALATKRLERMRQTFGGPSGSPFGSFQSPPPQSPKEEFVDFEEIESKPAQSGGKGASKSSENPYQQLFEDPK
ncbi:MAG: hypothetical protein ACK5SQ_08925 [Chitinophagales bacterium]|jgi:hypothetical protein